MTRDVSLLLNMTERVSHGIKRHKCCLIHKTKCGSSNTTLRVPGRILKVLHFQERPKFAARSGSQRCISGSQSEMWRVPTRTGAFHPADSAEIRT